MHSLTPPSGPAAVHAPPPRAASPTPWLACDRGGTARGPHSARGLHAQLLMGTGGLLLQTATRPTAIRGLPEGVWLGLILPACLLGRRVWAVGALLRTQLHHRSAPSTPSLFLPQAEGFGLGIEQRGLTRTNKD